MDATVERRDVRVCSQGRWRVLAQVARLDFDLCMLLVVCQCELPLCCSDLNGFAHPAAHLEQTSSGEREEREIEGGNTQGESEHNIIYNVSRGTEFRAQCILQCFHAETLCYQCAFGE
jgi:hypothetical protein